VAIRDNPYSAFNFLVRLGDIGGEDEVAGGFSDVTGLGNEVKYAEYRNGNDSVNHVRKIATMNVTQDVVLRRGLIVADRPHTHCVCRPESGGCSSVADSSRRRSNGLAGMVRPGIDCDRRRPRSWTARRRRPREHGQAQPAQRTAHR
jgi:T4-like virus tail tube protein gp19